MEFRHGAEEQIFYVVQDEIPYEPQLYKRRPEGFQKIQDFLYRAELLVLNMEYSKGRIKRVILVRFDDGDVLIDEIKKLVKKDLDPKTGLKLLRFL